MGVTTGLELMDQLSLRGLQPRASLGIAISQPQGGQSAVLEALLVASHGANRAAKSPRDIVLIGPALLHQAHHGEGFGHAVVDTIVGQRHPADHDDPVIILGANLSAVVDDNRAGRVASFGKQVFTNFGRHDR